MTKPASLCVETWIFHRHHGPAKMSRLDAAAAVRRFGNEWAYSPWSGDEPPDGADVEIVSDWPDLPEETRRGIAMRLDPTCSNKSQAEVDAIIGRARADRFAAGEGAAR